MTSRSLIRVLALSTAIGLGSAAQAETLYLASPNSLYSFDTDSGGSTAFAVPRGSVSAWSVPRPLRVTADGLLVCTADDLGPACYDTSTKQLRSSVQTSGFSTPWAWDVSQTGSRLVSASRVTGAQGSQVPGLRIVNATTGADVATLPLETYAVAVSPSGTTATALAYDVSDTAGAFAGKLPLMLATIDLETGALTRSVPVRDTAGARLYGGWALAGMVDTGASSFVVWNRAASESVMVIGADGTLRNRVAIGGVSNVVLSQDGGTGFAVGNGTKATRFSVATGAVTYEFTDPGTTGVTVPTRGDVIYTAGPLGGLPSASVLTWSLQNGAMVSRRPTSDAAVTSIAAVPAVRRLSAPETGWWWDPANGGTGFSIECSATSGRCFIGDFTYNSAGQAVWYVTSCALTSTNTCSGPIDEYRGGITLSGSYQAPTSTPGAAGTMTVAFQSATTATVSVTGRSTFAIQRYPINGTSISAPPAFAPQSGWWWSADEGGRGWFIETQNSVVQAGTTYGQAFLAGYMYETTGRSVWYIAQGLYTSVGTFGGSIPLFENTLNEFAGGPPLSGGSNSGLTVAGARGTLSVQFTSSTTGSLRLPNGRSVAITRFPIP